MKTVICTIRPFVAEQSLTFYDAGMLTEETTCSLANLPMFLLDKVNRGELEAITLFGPRFVTEKTKENIRKEEKLQYGAKSEIPITLF